MTRIEKVFFLAAFILCTGSLLYSYEDYYQKVYIARISKNEIYKVVSATKDQQKKLSKIFDRYQKKAEGIDNDLTVYEKKKERIGLIEKQRYEEISKVLSYDQLLKYDEYVKRKKSEFAEKNDRIRGLLDSLNLSNMQKSDILKYDRDFEREVTKLKERHLTEKGFIAEYNRLKEARNIKIRDVLTAEQLEILDKF